MQLVTWHFKSRRRCLRSEKAVHSPSKFTCCERLRAVYAARPAVAMRASSLQAWHRQRICLVLRPSNMWLATARQWHCRIPTHTFAPYRIATANVFTMRAPPPSMRQPTRPHSRLILASQTPVTGVSGGAAGDHPVCVGGARGARAAGGAPPRRGGAAGGRPCRALTRGVSSTT